MRFFRVVVLIVILRGSFTLYGQPSQNQWNLDVNGINAIKARNEFGVDGNGVTIAIIDTTGVNYNLADLNAGYLGGYDFCVTGSCYNCSGEDNDPMDVYGHGTQMATAMLGRGSSLYGVAPQAKYYAIKINNDNNKSSFILLLQAFDWVVQKGNVDIIFMGVKTAVWATMAYAIDSNYSQGILFIAPTYQGTYTSPAIYANVIGIGGHTKNVPQTITSDTGNYADVLAPGETVPVLDLNGNTTNAADMVGVAAAQATGALALMVDYNNTHHKDYTNSALWATLNQGAVTLNTGDPREGHGKTDVYNSILLMANDWFIDCNCQFLYPNFQENGLPGYFAGGQLNYIAKFSNNIPTEFTGHRDINGYYDDFWGYLIHSGLTITMSLRYDGHDSNSILDGNSIYEVNLPAGQSEQFAGSFSLDPNIAQGRIALYAKIVIHSPGVPSNPEAVIKRINCAYAAIRAPCGQQADFVVDKIVDLQDFAVMASWWLLPCDEANGWCNGTDIASDGIIDAEDLSVFAACWLCQYP